MRPLAAEPIKRTIDNRLVIKEWLGDSRRELIDALTTLTVRAERYMGAAVEAQRNGVRIPPSETLDEALREAVGVMQQLHWGEFKS